MAYNEFARFYDRVEGDTPAAFSQWILGRLDQYAAAVKSVLELGCGTGGVLEVLPREWCGSLTHVAFYARGRGASNDREVNRNSGVDAIKHHRLDHSEFCNRPADLRVDHHA